MMLHDIAEIDHISLTHAMVYHIFETHADAWDYYVRNRDHPHRRMNPPLYRKWDASVFDASRIRDHRS